MDVSRVVARANVPQNQAAYLKPGQAGNDHRRLAVPRKYRAR